MTINTANLKLLSLLIQHLLNAFLPLFQPLGLIRRCMCLCMNVCPHIICPNNLLLNLFLYSNKDMLISCYSFKCVNKIDSSCYCVLMTTIAYSQMKNKLDFSSDHYFCNM